MHPHHYTREQIMRFLNFAETHIYADAKPESVNASAISPLHGALTLWVEGDFENAKRMLNCLLAAGE